jgi:hypothetical protein
MHAEARAKRRPFVVPGLRRLLRLAGVAARRGGITIDVQPPLMPDGLPDDVAVLKAIVRNILPKNRQLRASVTVPQGEVQMDLCDCALRVPRMLDSVASFGKCRIPAPSQCDQGRGGAGVGPMS